ncbi:transcription-repair coupling factor [Jeotgalibaca sp. PTS2502]|uniref:transcription-repair coupling factor n=1 Tax=Jeotgalibaca sp. PTS2502 TaxID=1903686 RepID=UPI0009735D75|nr:transcription-repair coupling factor [Jeotgalibaca sp. PTS2502]APZ50075.1 transcription-repair coupling factor [Jeotgalibaca sp. PTS2502]
MKDIQAYLKRSALIADVVSHAREAGNQLVTGISGSARNLLTTMIYDELDGPIVVWAANLLQATQLYEDISQINPMIPTFLFPVEESLAVEVAFSSPEYRSQRVEALHFLESGEKGIVVVPTAGFKKLLAPVSIWRDHVLTFDIGNERDFEQLPEKLVAMGYERESMVASPGEFSVRGDIMDIYALNEEYPIRIEFFGSEVDRMRFFEPTTQKSFDEAVESVMVLPAQDTIFPPYILQEQVEEIEKKVKKAEKSIKHEDVKKRLTVFFNDFIEKAKLGELPQNPKMYTSLFYPQMTTIMDYVSKDTLIVMDEYGRTLESERTQNIEAADWEELKIGEGVLLPKQQMTADIRDVVKQSEHRKLFYSLFQKGLGNSRFTAVHPMQYRGLVQFFGQMPMVKSEVDRWLKQDATVFMVVPDKDRAEKVHQIFLDFGIESVIIGQDNFIENHVNLIVGGMATGFELPMEKLVVMTEKELFNKATKRQPSRQKMSNAERLKSYTELSTGDYVVHVNHGIGKYTGMETIDVDGVNQDYISILYQDGAKLFIPVTQLHLVQKYVSSESKTPKVNRLGGTEWAKTKKKVASRVEDIADELIELYAKRESEKGYAFPPDNQDQVDFENRFPYTETDDQLRSIEEIKKDMQKEKPMDRLLVGDVGYGKTEVAMRAIFKAVLEGKQAAFLVPTTILAQQHYESLVQRFEDLPFEIGLLSRFRTKKQQEETIEGIRKGSVDIIVGTHRLISKDVVFFDLGLLVVDEEQRFGVKHKERLKALKSTVDVLTLTATPIPRTLHMSMLGVRDLSVIETPPANRYPVQTYVMEQNMAAVRDGIEREMARGGQAFYVYNRVDTIERKADEIRVLVPDCRVGVAHGQMTEVQLENIMMDFVEGVYDVLVTTTIIETGVDIPNANTLFIENADYMGLSQLYQLRGRVGRTNRIAYAYLMHQRDKILSEVSEKRLQAIKDFTELGSGFKIAMRDLSIRGAGNLLGAQQHGFIDSVGFDLYSEMLSEAVERKRGKGSRRKQVNVEIDLAINAYIPATYIEDERQKIDMYKRIQQLKNEDDFYEIQDDFQDRFGDLPEEVTYLAQVGLIRHYAELAEAEQLKRQGDIVHITFDKEGTKRLQGVAIFEALSSIPLRAQVNMKKDQLVVSIQIHKVAIPAWMDHLKAFLEASVAEQKEES